MDEIIFLSRDVPDIWPFSISGIRPDSKFDIRSNIRLAGYLEPDILNIQFNTGKLIRENKRK